MKKLTKAQIRLKKIQDQDYFDRGAHAFAEFCRHTGLKKSRIRKLLRQKYFSGLQRKIARAYVNKEK